MRRVTTLGLLGSLLVAGAGCGDGGGIGNPPSWPSSYPAATASFLVDNTGAAPLDVQVFETGGVVDEGVVDPGQSADFTVCGCDVGETVEVVDPGSGAVVYDGTVEDGADVSVSGP